MTQLAEKLEYIDLNSANNEFLSDVLTGLNSRQKFLSSKYFYDQEGSRLFEQICELDEYYVTRTECRILETYKHEIAENFGRALTIIEPGSGAGKKVAILLDALHRPSRFVSLEISREALKQTSSHLSVNFPNITQLPMLGDFTNTSDLKSIANQLDFGGEQLVFFPGSTIGNFEYHDAVHILGNLKLLAGNGGKILLGADLIKNRQRLISAYDDARGITAQFNKNILYRINRELNANFNVSEGFFHRAIFNEDHSRIEMHLISTAKQTVSIGGYEFSFHAGESIHTENSHKYSVASIHQLAAEADLQIVSHWTDEDKDFGLFLLQADQ